MDADGNYFYLIVFSFIIKITNGEVFLMLKAFDVKTKSITEAKRDLSKIIKDTQETGEPTFIFNINEPEAIILSNTMYEELVKSYNELEDKLFYSQLNERVAEGAGKLIPARDVIKSNSEHNLFVDMSDEELFN